ncbi:MAG: protein-L-isoaspartate(D-aspartate) O-methyltransferase [Caldilineaceae bacterium]|jgi:protein-L-isoaspartate(D-aspartate) O-methyltransferase
MEDSAQEPDFPWANSWPEITNRRVRDAFAKVSREEFVGSDFRDCAGQDAPLPIGEGQTISQPFVVALMTQACNPQPGERVLEIGTGSGFQTAILCELTRQADGVAGETVFTIERYVSLAQAVVPRLRRMGYTPHVVTGDGAAGWQEVAPFDVIMVTAAPRCLPVALWRQLADGGRLVIPIGKRNSGQMLWLFELVEGRMRRTMLGPVRFVPLVSPLLELAENCIEFDS